VEATRRRFALYRTKKEQYWNNRLLQCGRLSPQLWRSMNSIMFERQRDVSSSASHTAEGFAAFFKRKLMISVQPLRVHSHRQSTVSQQHHS